MIVLLKRITPKSMIVILMPSFIEAFQSQSSSSTAFGFLAFSSVFASNSTLASGLYTEFSIEAVLTSGGT